MTTALYYDDLFLEHRTGAHPECPARLVCAVQHLKDAGLWDRCVRPTPGDADPDDLALVHERDYVERVLRLAERGGGALDADTPVSRDSGRAALRAAGAVRDACDLVLDGKARNALCLVRPPGHHARPGRGMGFCLFNNVAIAAAHLTRRKGLERVAIVDWDVHHGNGTQEMFWDDQRVFYFSMHLWPFYPGTGQADEAGVGRGQGTTLNVPVPHGVTADQYLRLFREAVQTRLTEYRPQFVLISAGFDAYQGDPIGGAGLDVADFRRMTDIVAALAADSCGGRLVSALEGGYSLDGLPLCVATHLEGLLAASAGTEHGRERPFCVVGLAGVASVGKGEAVKFLRQWAQARGWRVGYLSFSDQIKEEARSRGVVEGDFTRELLSRLATEMRQAEGPAVLAARILGKIRATPPENAPNMFIVEAIRHPSEIDLLRQSLDRRFVCLAVVAELDTIAGRLLARGRPDESREAMRGREHAIEIIRRELEGHPATGVNVAECLDRADARIPNDGSLDDLRRAVFAAMDRVAADRC